MSSFTHLHVHSQYSILDGAASIKGLVKKCKESGMTALALTDHGSMYGIKEFHKIATKEGIKPILGCETYIARNSRFEKSSKEDRSGNHLILLAKNLQGYQNLLKIISYSWTEGYYYKPRIDKELLVKYHQGIIASSACLGGEISQALLQGDVKKAEETAMWYKKLFGDDYYLEIMLHRSNDPKVNQDVYENQLKINPQIIHLGERLNIKVIATNDVHFLKEDDAEAHDVFICINTQSEFDDYERLRYTKQEFLKTPSEMASLFPEYPEALANTMEIADKVESFSLSRKPIMPKFTLPAEFTDDDEYLKHITYEGAKQRWGSISEDVKERLDFELETIKKMGFPGYFLIVWDFLKAARDMGVSVGPGRGSAAGSAVAYCLRITDIDPIKYNLLFERFLNPDRISMPDIDIDFDEDGREKVIQWVIEKYGQKRVANIVTFGSMAPKMAIRDVARVIKLPLHEADRLAKLIPEKNGTTFEDAFKEVPELMKEKSSNDPLIIKTLELAEKLEGSIRQTGVHACGIIIGRDDLEEHIPLSTSKDATLFVTQYEGSHVEDVGMLKMDFLGLKTLSIIKDAVINVKKSRGIDVDPDAIPLDDELTYKLYSKAETTGLFQFESDGMKKYLRDLKPNRFEDLIAMNALYRPGPMEYIPQFVRRKHGKDQIIYDLPEMEEILKDTYGITVYQEQVMQLSQKLAGFTKGQADSLRKAMGKKIKEMMDDLKGKFIEGALQQGHDKDKLEKIWKDWEAFAEYAFNKSHSTCYAYVSYQTAYLKAHYPAEFMAAVLSRNISSIDKITQFMDECRRMGIQVLGPDVNESDYTFTVNKEGNIRFGLGGIKGVGEAAVLKIVEEREKKPFTSIFDFVERVHLQSVNKKNLEALALAGAFDNFRDIQRHEFFLEDEKNVPFIENIIRYGNKFQLDKQNSGMSLFGEGHDVMVSKPSIPKGEEWSTLYKLDKEKEVVGIYLSSHPLNEYKFEIDSMCNIGLSELKEPKKLAGKDLIIAGLVTEARHATTKNGKPFGNITIEDFNDSFKIFFFSNDYINFSKYLQKGYTLLIRGQFQEKTWAKEAGELEFKVKTIDLLANVREEKIKSIALKVCINDISNELVEEINQFSDEKAGKAMIRFIIWDPDDNMHIEMFSRNKRLNISDKFIDFITTTPEIEFKVN